MSEIKTVYIEDGEVRWLIDPLTHDVTSKKQKEGYKRQLEKIKDTRYFTFAHMESLLEVISNLSNVHLGYLLHLQCYIDLHTGFLHDKENKVITKKVDIQKILGIQAKTNQRLCKELEDNGILEVVDGKYRINPKYHFKGQAHDQKVIKLFSTTLKRLCETIKAKELGFLYKLLPYVHLSTNMICINPFEKDLEKVEYLNIEGIADITGLTRQSVANLIDELKKDKIVAKTTIEDERHTFITLNPYIFYRISGKPNDNLKVMFVSSPYSAKIM
jgi:DNA-binding MarR family transcriptional regulator